MRKINFKQKALVAAVAPLMLSSMASAEISKIKINPFSQEIIQKIKEVRRGGTSVLLVDQTSGTVGSAFPDQDFEAVYDAYDSVVADDFVVTDPGGWLVDEIRTLGTHSDDDQVVVGGPAQNVSIVFYTDNAGSPGAPVAGCSYSNIATSDQPDGSGDPSGTLFTTLPTPCFLPQGTYWVSHQTTQDYATANQHYIGTQVPVAGGEATFMNAGDGFGTGCTAFAPIFSTCGLGTESVDMTFVLFGIIQEPDLALTKTNDTGGNPVAMGATVNYTLTVENVGTGGAATGVVLTDTLPAGMTFGSASCDDSTTGTFATPNITFNLNDIAFGATTTCTVTATVSDFGAHVNTATVTSDFDVDTTNNDASSTVQGPVEVDMSITKTSNAVGQVATNAPVTYTLTVNNNSADAANNVTVTDVLPSQVTYSNNTCGASEAGGTITWNVGTVTGGNNATCDINVTVTGFGTFDNTATVSADETDNTPANNSSSTTVEGPVAAAGVDLALVKTTSAAGQQSLGATVNFTLTVTNNSTNTSTNTIVTDNLPTGLDYAGNDCGASVSGNTITWNIGTLAGGSNASCNISATVSGVGNLTNTASVTSEEVDNNTTDNSDDAVIQGPPAVDLQMIKTVTVPDPLAIGDTVVYSLRVNNINTGDANNVVVTDTLPANVTYVSNTCGATISGTTVTWNIGTLIAGTSATCDISVTVDVAGNTNNTASVSTSDVDINAGNNNDSANFFLGEVIIIPTLSVLSLLLMMLTLGFFGRKMLAKD